jgi:hypothetical protein
MTKELAPYTWGLTDALAPAIAAEAAKK